MYVKIIGLVAATLTTIAFLPQAVKTWKTRSTDDLSPAMFGLFCTGVLLWFIYGLSIRDFPIILANGATICLAGSILFFIVKPKRSKKIEHIGLWVTNLEEMKDFYCTHFNASAGNKYINKKKQFSSYFLSFSLGTRIELMHNPDQKTGENWGHISIQLPSKEHVNLMTENLREKGIPILSNPRTTCDGYYESVISDPEGNQIELMA